MSLTPEDVERKVFKQEFRGYSQAEVDIFLDLVTERLTELGRERDLLLTRLRDAERHGNERVARVEAYAEERIAEIEKRASEAIETERHLKRALVTAERAADETLQSAQTRAEDTLTEAQREAEQILGDAHRQAATMLADMRKRTAQAQDTCQSEVERIQRTVTTFTTLRDEYRDRVRSFAEDYLAQFDEAGEPPEVPRQLIDLATISEPTWTDLPDKDLLDSTKAFEVIRGEASGALVDAELHNGEDGWGVKA